MDIESLTERLMECVYHAAVQHPDPVVQERIVKSDVWNLLEDFVVEIKAEVSEDFICPECQSLEREVEELTEKVKELETA